MLANEGGAVALGQHVGLTDKLVDASAAGGQVCEGVVVPVVRAVVLGVGEGAGVARGVDQLDDPHGDARVGEAFCRVLNLRIAPPFPYMRLCAPVAEEREVGLGDGAKAVAQPCLSSVSRWARSAFSAVSSRSRSKLNQ